MEKSLKIWCTYHDDKLLNEYDLHNTKNIQLFNTDKMDLKEDNINYLHDYLSEMSTYYYVWKNQIKTDYVGFCQYRRYFINIKYDQLEKNGIQAYLNCINGEKIKISHHDCVNEFFLYNFANYIYHTYKLDVGDYLINKLNTRTAYHSMFIYRWDIFNEVCEYIFGFISYLTNGKWKNEANIRYLSTFFSYEFCLKNGIWERAYAVVNEILLGIFINIMYNVELADCEVDGKYYITLQDKITNYDSFNKWYKKNIKTGIIHYNIGDVNYKILKQMCKERNQLIEYVFPYAHEYSWQHEKEIILNLNQKIVCEDSIEFNKGKFCIKNIERI